MHRIRSILLIAALLLPFSCSSAGAEGIFPVAESLCRQMQAHGVLKPQAPVACDRLRVIRFSYLGFDGQARHDGEIMMLDAVAESVLRIFQALLENGFRIRQAKMMHEYDGDDALSMASNNTSGFNHRLVTNGTAPSLHAYGLAIDLNPAQNPYIAFEMNGLAHFSPPSSVLFANRLSARPGKPARHGMAEEAVRIFAAHGFSVWGGYWDNPIDYQHFQVPRELAEKLVALPAHEAEQLFRRHRDGRKDGCAEQLRPPVDRTGSDCTNIPSPPPLSP